MTFLSDVWGMLAFRARSLRARADRCAWATGVLCFSAGFLAFVAVRNSVYAVLPELTHALAEPLSYWVHLNLIQALLFVLLIYIPAIILVSHAISGHGPGFTLSGRDYREHVSALLPLWGMLLLIAAPLQYFAPQFLVVGIFGISVGMFVLLMLLVLYSPWAIQRLNGLSAAQALGVFSLSCVTLPVYYLLTSSVYALLFIAVIPLALMACRSVRGLSAKRARERALRRDMRTLASDPLDGGAHCRLGMTHLSRGDQDAAQRCFEDAIKIDPVNPDYHYALGRLHELKGEWAQALRQYEKAWKLDPGCGSGDVVRETGKAYLHTGQLEKGAELLRAFLAKKGGDPEGRFWLAVAAAKMGDAEQMRIQLYMILDQARSGSRMFRTANREWLNRASRMIRDSL